MGKYLKYFLMIYLFVLLPLLIATQAFSLTIPSDGTSVKFTMSSYTGFDSGITYEAQPTYGDILSGLLYIDNVFDKNNPSTVFKENGDQLIGYFEGAKFLSTSNSFVNYFDVSESNFSVWNDNSESGLDYDNETTIQEIKDAQLGKLIFDGAFEYFKIYWDDSLKAFVTEAYVDIHSKTNALWDDAYWDDQTVDIDGSIYTYDILFTAVATAADSSIWTYFNDVENDPLEGVFSSNAVPEPTTMILFSIGLLGHAGIGRRKQ